MFTGFFSKEVSDFNIDKIDFLGFLTSKTSSKYFFKKSDTFYTQHTEVSFFKKSDGRQYINFTYSFNPNFFSWLLGICFFPLGFLIFIISQKEKNDFEFFLTTVEI